MGQRWSYQETLVPSTVYSCPPKSYPPVQHHVLVKHVYLGPLVQKGPFNEQT